MIQQLSEHLIIVPGDVLSNRKFFMHLLLNINMGGKSKPAALISIMAAVVIPHSLLVMGET